jgi:hypothetical protein
MAVKVHSFSNISCVQNGALANAEFVCAGFNQRKSKASTARSFAVQDLPRLTLTGLMRISEPNGVRVAEFSSIWTSMTRFPLPCLTKSIAQTVRVPFNF